MFYKSLRVGKNGKKFWMYKLKTLRDNFDKTKSFADESAYTKYGHFLRKLHLDELPQFVNIIKGEMTLFGWRPEEEKTWNNLPQEVKNVLSSTKPGIIDLASIHFIDEEKLLKFSEDPYKDYWLIIRPMKFTLQAFYIQNRSILLNLAILWIVFKKLLKILFNYVKEKVSFK